MSQDTGTAGGATAGERPEPRGPVAPMGSMAPVAAPRTGPQAVPGPPTGGFPAGPRSAHAQHPGRVPYPSQPFPAQPYAVQPYPAQPYPGQPYAAQPYPGPYVPGPRPTPTGPHGAVNAGPYAWVPAEDDEEARPASNAPAAFSIILGLLALLISFRPLAFGSMAMSWDTYVALGIAVVALIVGGAGLRRAVSRPAAVIGMTISVAAMLVVAILPTI